MKKSNSLLVLPFVLVALMIVMVPFARTGSVTAKVYVANAEGDDLTVIDPVSLRVIGNIKVGSKPHGLVASPSRDRIYVSVEGTNRLLAVDTTSHRIVGQAEVGQTPNQVTVTADGKFVYVPLRGQAAVDIVDTTTMKVVKRVALAEWPHNSYTSADGKRVYVTTINGKKIFVFDPSTHNILSIIEPGGKVRPVALTKDGSLMYVALSELHGFAVVDVQQRKTIKRVELAPLPPDTPRPYLDTYTHGLALTPDERELWVTSCAGGAVWVFSVPDLRRLAKVDVGKFPNWLAFSSDGKTLFVSNTESDAVSAIDVGARKVVATILVGKAPKRIIFVSSPRRLD